jgi:hypothetical protein
MIEGLLKDSYGIVSSILVTSIPIGKFAYDWGVFSDSNSIIKS